MYKQFAKLFFAGFVAGFAVCFPGQILAQDEEPIDHDNTRNCIDLRSVRRTEIVDDRNILFHMRGSMVYHNILPHQCGGLARENRFSYKTSMRRLCDIDTIRVLYSDPFGLREGNVCQLGLFHEMTREDARAFKEGANRPTEAAPLPMPDPQEIGVEKKPPEDPESG